MNGSEHAPARVPAWSSPVDALRLIARGHTFPTCARVALFVGVLLSLVNQGAVVADGDTSTATAVRIGVNFVVPFVVSSIGYLAPFRTPRAAIGSGARARRHV